MSFNPTQTPESLIDDLERLKTMYAARASGDNIESHDFMLVRNRVANNPLAKDLLPSWVRRYQTDTEFWNFIQPKFRSYQERRNFIHSELAPLIKHLEQQPSGIGPAIAEASHSIKNSHQVLRAWDIAIYGKQTDPEGAITAARSLLETVCRNILHDARASPPADSATLPQIYKVTADLLNLSPSSHTEDIFRRILGGCANVVNGLGDLRNQLGDAHGAKPQSIRPVPRHAALAVNLAGSLALYLIETWEDRPVMQ